MEAAERLSDRFWKRAERFSSSANDLSRSMTPEERAHQGDVAAHWRKMSDRSMQFIGEEGGAGEGVTQYGEHTLPGGKNYKELLLRLPLPGDLPRGWSVSEVQFDPDEHPPPDGEDAYTWEVRDDEGYQRGIGNTRQEAL